MKNKKNPKVLQQLDARQQSLWNMLNSYSQEVHDILVVKPSEIKAALEEIDESSIVEAFTAQLKPAFDFISENGAEYNALIAQWTVNYGRAEGYACKIDNLTDFSGTDLIKTPDKVGIERNEPEIDEDYWSEDIISIDVYAVMRKWWDELAVKYDDADYTNILNTPLHTPFNDSKNIYDELFTIKFFGLVEKASSTVFEEGCPYIFIGNHNRWPVLVAGE